VALVPAIFVSYSSKHRDPTRELVAAIEAQYGAGSVWWDHALESWGDYEIQICNALNEARVVVVIWTRTAGESDWVKSEAGRANRDGKLVNVRPPDTTWRDVPSPYDQHHVNGLEDTDGILRSIAAVWRGELTRTLVPEHEIYFRQHGYRLLDPKQRPLPRLPREISPTDLLQPKFEVVPYADITGMRGDLIAWCRDGSRATAGRLVHGPGGLGKTRLLIEVAAALRSDGWMAGFLERPHVQAGAISQQRWQALDQLIGHGDDKGLLIVMDYAEARQDEIRAISERLSRRSENDGRRARLVLLTRSAGDWWTALHDEMAEVQSVFRRDPVSADVVALSALAADRQRRDLFLVSTKAFRPTLAAQGYVVPGSEPPHDLLARIETGASYARPLAVQMAALLWLASDAPAAGTSTDVLLQRVLGLERAHWRKLLGALDADRERDMARGVAQVTIVQGTNSRASTERLLMADQFYQGQRTARVQVDPIIRDLVRVYGKPGEGLAHLEPDLIGEHHVAVVGDVELIEGCLHWIEAEPPEMQAKRRYDLLAVLQRASRSEHGAMAERASEVLDHLVRGHAGSLAADMVAVMVDTPGALGRQVDTLDDEALAALDAALPLMSLALMEFSLRVAERRAHIAREISVTAETGADTTSEERPQLLDHLAGRLGTLGIRLSQLGRRERALMASQEAADIHRRLAESRPDTFLPDLATSLNNLGIRLSQLGRREEALAASQEAIDIRRQLVQSRPNAFLSDLAMSLNNLGADLSNLGRREEALTASQESVDIRRQLVQSRPDAFLPDLAMSLNNLGGDLSSLGRYEEALAASQEAVDIRRRLAETRPDAFLPDLAMSLNNLGIRLSNLGRRQEALAASQEGVDIYRRLAETRPDAFLPDLAASLNNLGIRLSSLGRHEEALAASQEGVDIRRRLAKTRPDAFLPDLASSLNNLGIRLSDLGRREEALAASQEAVDIYRRLAETRPDAFLPNLATSISVMSDVLAALDRHSEAAQAAGQALAILLPFAERYPETYRNLARTIMADVLGYSEKAETAPDKDLLQRADRVIGSDVSHEEGS
jgi:tetratricopeptide (TPR) repeat protein